MHKNELTLSREKRRLEMRKKATPYLLLAPVFIFVCCFMLWPILNVFKMSLEQYIVTQPRNRHFIGLENFKTIFSQDPIFWRALGTTAIYVLVSVAEFPAIAYNNPMIGVYCFVKKFLWS